MDYKTQKILRIITTAIIMMTFLSLALGVFNISLVEDLRTNKILQNLSSPTFSFIFFVILAYFYHRMVSKFLYKFCFKDTETMISTKIITLCQTLNKNIMPKRALEIFYVLIDEDNNLTIKSLDVRLNGYVLSAITDIFIFTIILLPFYICSQKFCWYITLSTFIVLIAIEWILILKLKGIHKDLSSKQLSRIEKDLYYKLKKLTSKQNKFKQILDILIND